MSREEFLSQLKSSLSLDLSERAVLDQMNYYSNYINEEIAKGRSEGEVLDELGDPTLIAKTIVDVKGMKGESRQTSYSSEHITRSQTTQTNSYENKRGFLRIIGLDTGLKIALAAIAVIGCLVIVGLIFRALLPFVAPLIIILIVIRILNRK